MARDSFVFFRSFFEAIKRMPPEVQTEVYPAIVEYALDGKEPKGKKCAQFGKLGGRPKKGKAASSAKSKGEVPVPSSSYTLTLQQEVEQMKADRTWNEPVCMQFHISPEDFSKRLDAFLNHCQCEYEGKPHKDINDAKRHFMSWSRKAYPPVERADTDDELPPPSYEFNGGFGGQDI